MEHIKRFAAYAAAFERAYESDEWSEVETYFAEDAVYEVGLPILGTERCEGRAAIIAWFKDVLDRFDRRFASRTLTLVDGPTEHGNEVCIGGYATYRAEGVPDLELRLEERIRFEGDRIVYLEDRYTPQMLAETVGYVLRHGEKLGIEQATSDRS
jgi:hypothetical protein